MTIFYAYINNIDNDATLRLVLIFQDSSTADEWWRAVSQSSPGGSALLRDSIQRVSPQLYTHNVMAFNVYYFFTDTRITDIAKPFRGRLIITLDNDRAGRGISIIPPQNVTNLVSGNRFYIRSKSDPRIYWYLDPNFKPKKVCASSSDTKRTLFRVSVTAQDLPAPTIIIGSDSVVLAVTSQLGIDNNKNIIASDTKLEETFLFSDLADGRFLASSETESLAIIYNAEAPEKAPGWELVQ